MPTHTRGTTFSDTDPTNRRVTAARLHQLVEEAVHTSGGIGTSAIADSAVTDAKVATGISGTKVSAATLALTALAGGTQGDLITRGGSNYETLGIGTARYPLVVNSGATGLEYAQLTQAAIGASVISGHSALSDPAIADALLVYDDSAGVNLKVTLENLYKSIAGLTEETTVAADDEVLVYDTSASAPRRMSRSNFVSGLGSSSEFYYYQNFWVTGNTLNNVRAGFGMTTEDSPHGIASVTTALGAGDGRYAAAPAPFDGEVTRVDVVNISGGSQTPVIDVIYFPSFSSTTGNTSLANLSPGALADEAQASGTFSSSNTFTQGQLIGVRCASGNNHLWRVGVTYKLTIS